MHRVRFQPSGRSVDVPGGTTLLDAALRARMPLARACAGEGLCGRCGLVVQGDPERVSPESEDERRVKSRNRVASELRLACRARVNGDVDVGAAYW